MRFQFCLVAAVVLGGLTPVRAGITVSTSDTGAQTNAYAPLDKSAYYAIDQKSFTSPATADVAQDWVGTNVGGSTNTWHMVASAHINTTTSIAANSYTVTASGSFSYSISTTADFIDPTTVTTIFIPADSAGYQGIFTIDVPGTYVLSATLGHHTGVSLSSFTTGTVYNKLYSGAQTFTVSQFGTIPAGMYQVTASEGSATSFLPGENEFADAGSFSDFSFSLQVPEPSLPLMAVLALVSCAHWRLRRPFGA
jgi:hypothetical protein